MYEAFFGLHTEPFSIAPDPRFLYMSDKHREALGLLAHGLQRGASFTLLSGEIGAGKTTVWRRFLEQLPPNVDVANVVNPRLDVTALLSRVCEDLRVPLPEAGRPVDLIDALHGHLLLAQASGRRTLIVIDEAQALSDDVLEQLRLLTNLDSTGKKLQVMLIAQPEMREILERPELEPLAQRVVMRYHLPALDESETAGYIAHRLTVAGYNGPLPFDGEALMLIHRLCRGVPRRINVLCDVCLIGAQAAGVRRVGQPLVVESAAKVFGVRPKLPAPPPPDPLAPQPGPRAAPQPAPEPASEAPPAHAPAPAPAPTPAPAPAPTPAPAPAPAPAAAAAGTPAPEPAGPGPSRTLVTAGALLAAMAAGAWLGPKLMLPGTPPAVSAGAPAPVAAAAQPEAPPPAVAVPAVPVPVEPALSDRLFTAAQADEGAAFQALARLWKAEIPAADACSAAASQGLECYRARGGLALLRQLDRPGLLRLVDERGRVAHVLLQGLDGDMALLAIGGSVQRVPLAELGRWWRGEFATLWRVPPGWRAGEGGGAPAAWLAQHLAVVDGQRAASGAAAESLRARIMAFQVTRGLVPDGLAGPLTLMLLNAASGVDEPHLGAGGALTIGNRPS